MTDATYVPWLPTAEPSRAAEDSRVVEWLRVHRTSLLIAVPLLALAGTVHVAGMSLAPTIVDDEGTYTAQAWAIERWHTLAHYTYWYDHPPVGWVQIAGWTWLTDAFDRNGVAVMAGREAMAVAKVISAGLIYVLCRRVGMNRFFAAVALLLFSLSPLAMEFSRSVYLDNVAIPWLLGSFVLAASPRRSLAAAAGSAACFAVAVLSKETTLILFPAVACMIWQHHDRRTRRLVLAVAGTLFLSIVVFYPLYALLRGELFEGDGHVSLLWAARWQLLSRPSSGSVLDPSSPARNVVESWLRVDSVLLVASVVALPVALALRRLRAVGIALAVQLVMMLRDGYLPFPYVIALAPFAAVVVAGAGDAAWRATARWRESHALKAVRAGTVALGAVAVVLVATAWTRGLNMQTEQDHVAPMRNAVGWLEDHAPRDSVIVVEDSLWVDLVERGYDPDKIVWFFKLDLDPAVKVASWRQIDYLAIKPFAPDGLGSLPKNAEAIEHSEQVASYGEGPGQITIRRIVR